MGYYTRYELKHTGKAIEELDEVLSSVTGYEWRDLDIGDECKWYDNDKHMRNISAMFPEILFTLSGEGEESGDIWKAYHKNGKCQYTKAEMTFEDFDEAKLE